ncbi:hypothetical protein PROFUN_16808 [Planoprotostelium fungivorum]|uniref:Uncharacterized protein n=1 Tax=Planoprotostelium fungivorum TaxID=1890364 RepID=A0A2P6MNP0_9EUKA|nr:hypothetical protein PROFUN_16808 [Planoprotostelium fungivorum]
MHYALKLNSRSDLALILGVLKQYCSAEESDDPYTMHLWSHIDPIPNVAYKPCLLATTPLFTQPLCVVRVLWQAVTATDLLQSINNTFLFINDYIYRDIHTGIAKPAESKSIESQRSSSKLGSERSAAVQALH